MNPTPDLRLSTQLLSVCDVVPTFYNYRSALRRLQHHLLQCSEGAWPSGQTLSEIVQEQIDRTIEHVNRMILLAGELTIADPTALETLGTALRKLAEICNVPKGRNLVAEAEAITFIDVLFPAERFFALSPRARELVQNADYALFVWVVLEFGAVLRNHMFLLGFLMSDRLPADGFFKSRWERFSAELPCNTAWDGEVGFAQKLRTFEGHIHHSIEDARRKSHLLDSLRLLQQGVANENKLDRLALYTLCVRARLFLCEGLFIACDDVSLLSLRTIMSVDVTDSVHTFIREKLGILRSKALELVRLLETGADDALFRARQLVASSQFLLQSKSKLDLYLGRECDSDKNIRNALLYFVCTLSEGSDPDLKAAPAPAPDARCMHPLLLRLIKAAGCAQDYKPLSIRNLLQKIVGRYHTYCVNNDCLDAMTIAVGQYEVVSNITIAIYDLARLEVDRHLLLQHRVALPNIRQFIKSIIIAEDFGDVYGPLVKELADELARIRSPLAQYVAATVEGLLRWSLTLEASTDIPSNASVAHDYALQQLVHDNIGRLGTLLQTIVSALLELESKKQIGQRRMLLTPDEPPTARRERGCGKSLVCCCYLTL